MIETPRPDTYAALGVKELWLVDETGETFELRTLSGDRYLEGRLLAKGDRLQSLVIPGLSIEVTEVFEGWLSQFSDYPPSL